jgi:hypothetical protein
MATLAEILRGYQPPTKSALADPIKEHFRTLPQQLETNQRAMDKTMAGMYKTDFMGKENPNYYPEAIQEFTQNYAPNVMGSIAKVAPTIERFLIAQKNAALPVTEGGLGLAANNTAAQRAKALGYDTPAYHGTRIDFQEFQPKSWFSSDPKYASDYSNVKMRIEPENPTQQVLPVLTKITKPHKVQYFGSEADMNKILDGGKKQTYVIENVGGGNTSHYVIKDPKNIRSVNAAFDPKRAKEADILAAGLAVPMPKEEEKKTRKELIKDQINKID